MLKKTLATTAVVAISMIGFTGVSSAQTEDETRGEGGSKIYLSYNAATKHAKGQASGTETSATPWLEYKSTIPIIDQPYEGTDSTATAKGQTVDSRKAEGPYRACVVTSMDIGSGGPQKVICTNWIDGK